MIPIAMIHRGGRNGIFSFLSLASIASIAVHFVLVAPAAAGEPADALYHQHCAECHGPDRLGAMGPALLPENLARLRKPEAVNMIRDSRPAVQMPAFRELLKPEEIQSLADFIYTPVSPLPKWGEKEIAASRVIHHAPGTLPDKPQFQADPMNLFVVVEAGDHHVTILDGDRLEPIHRFPTRYALHGGPKFTPDGRYVYFASRDGWISKFDIWNLKTVAEVRAGINTRNAAVSGDGKYVMVANYLPHTLVVLDATNLNLVKILPVTDKEGKQSSRVSAVYDAAPRHSFVAALKDVKEVWEISY
ncbi:MAG TPA: cytochrome D1 domain-containing protein, partial [Burkholderiales bacterium]|nr:cytochrome D1 domain-containing protein [Burkholderiales bacterium]